MNILHDYHLDPPEDKYPIEEPDEIWVDFQKDPDDFTLHAFVELEVCEELKKEFVSYTRSDRYEAAQQELTTLREKVKEQDYLGDELGSALLVMTLNAVRLNSEDLAWIEMREHVFNVLRQYVDTFDVTHESAHEFLRLAASLGIFPTAPTTSGVNDEQI